MAFFFLLFGFVLLGRAIGLAILDVNPEAAITFGAAGLFFIAYEISRGTK